MIIAGDANAGDTQALLSVVREQFHPNLFVLLVDSDQTRSTLVAWMPYVAGVTPVNGRAAAYVCRDYACQLPVSIPDDLVKLLQ